MKIIIIDDDESWLEMLKSWIKIWLGENTIILTFSSFFQVEEKDFNDCFLVITDYQMPDISGIEVVEWLKQQHPEIKVILMSGINFLKSKADWFIPKYKFKEIEQILLSL
ncbi:MAG TPA: response regulator [Candidatus Pacearchaeota archaeon]|nr:response regulator [Candidatus Paceibacterota bacterium]HOK00378.1 response regulator [Candidatus Pacearchaeota archaeon]HOL90193.1 response regulator [Candidatus Pacearchaeota archaeon]